MTKFIYLLLLCPILATAQPLCERALSEGPLPPGYESTKRFSYAYKYLQNFSQFLMNRFGPEAGVYWVGYSEDDKIAPRFGYPDEYAIVTRTDLIAAALKNSDLIDRGYQQSVSLGIKTGRDSILVTPDSVPSEVQKWKWAHKALAPFFRPRYLEQEILPRVQEEARQTVDRWLSAGRAVVNADIERYTLANVFGPLFGKRLPAAVDGEFTSLLDMFFTAHSEKAARAARVELEKAVRPIVNEARRRSTLLDGHLVHQLLRVQAEENLPESWIYDQMITLYFAGQVTTKVMIGMALNFLAEHPAYAAEMRAEYSEFLRGERAFEDLRASRNFLSEVLRLYPPVPILNRFTTADVRLGDYVIPKGKSVLLNLYAGFMREETWGARPREFRPERFEDSPAGKYDFCPFGFGPRICIGQNLALMEGQILLGELLTRTRSVELARPFVKPDPQNTSLLVIRDDLALTFRR